MDWFSPPPKLGFVTVETTTYCTLRCQGCSRTIAIGKNEWSNRHMSWEVFTGIMDHLPPSGYISLHGVGEPTLNPKILEMVRYANSLKKFDNIGIISNGLVRAPEFYKELVNSGLTQLTISVDSLDPEISQIAREGTDVEKLKAQLRSFSNDKLPLHISMVASRFNKEEMFSTLSTLNEIGGMTVYIQPFHDVGNSTGCLTHQELLLLKRSLEEKAVDWKKITIQLTEAFHETPLKKTLKQTKIKARKWLRNFAPVGPGPICYDPWYSPAVTVDGFLTPCCVVWDAEVLQHLSIAENSFEKIWKGDQFQKFIREYISQAPGFCHGCPKNIRSTCSKELHSNHHINK